MPVLYQKVALVVERSYSLTNKNLLKLFSVSILSQQKTPFIWISCFLWNVLERQYFCYINSKELLSKEHPIFGFWIDTLGTEEFERKGENRLKRNKTCCQTLTSLKQTILYKPKLRRRWAARLAAEFNSNQMRYAKWLEIRALYLYGNSMSNIF